MLPVASSAPAITTSMRPTVNAAPVMSSGMLPHAFGRPADTTTASSAPNAMYAPARKPPVSVLPNPCLTLAAPASVAAAGISCAGMNAMGHLPFLGLSGRAGERLHGYEDVVAAHLDRVGGHVAAVVPDRETAGELEAALVQRARDGGL